MSPYAKSIVAGVVAALIAGLQAAHDTLPMSPTTRAWVTVGLAVAGAVAVWAVPNKPAAAPESARPLIERTRQGS